MNILNLLMKWKRANQREDALFAVKHIRHVQSDNQ